MTTEQPRIGDLVALFQWQADTCRSSGSPLYAELLDHLVAELRVGRAPWPDLLRPWEYDPIGAALPLRLLGAVHGLVLESKAPELERWYPSMGGAVEASGEPWAAFRITVLDNLDAVADGLSRNVQTNEVGRSASLVGGFLTVARETKLPLRLLEVGASAGLNLRFDRYHYIGPNRAWGPSNSRVQFEGYLGQPPFHVGVEIASRRGCDPDPVPTSTARGRRTLESFVWPDMVTRFQRLHAALTIARHLPVTVDRRTAVPWLTEQLAEPVPGVATVVFHSIVQQYLTRWERHRMRTLIEEAGGRAEADAPLAWLRLEPGRRPDRAELVLRLWPGGVRRLLARSAFHGPPVEWISG